MKMTIESTTRTVTISDASGIYGVECRVWEGLTERGVEIHCLIPRISVHEGQDIAQFEAELREMKPPSAASEVAFPSRMIL